MRIYLGDLYRGEANCVEASSKRDFGFSVFADTVGSESGNVFAFYRLFKRGSIYLLNVRVSILVGTSRVYYVCGFVARVYYRRLAVRGFSSKYYVVYTYLYLRVDFSLDGFVFREGVGIRSTSGLVVSSLSLLRGQGRVFPFGYDVVAFVGWVYGLYVSIGSLSKDKQGRVASTLVASSSLPCFLGLFYVYREASSRFGGFLRFSYSSCIAGCFRASLPSIFIALPAWDLFGVMLGGHRFYGPFLRGCPGVIVFRGLPGVPTIFLRVLSRCGRRKCLRPPRGRCPSLRGTFHGAIPSRSSGRSKSRLRRLQSRPLYFPQMFFPRTP